MILISFSSSHRAVAMFRIGLKRNRIFLLVVVVLSPLMYHVIQEERRGKLTFALDVAITLSLIHI